MNSYRKEQINKIKENKLKSKKKLLSLLKALKKGQSKVSHVKYKRTY
jgi:hypothetical protein